MEKSKNKNKNKFKQRRRLFAHFSKQNTGKEQWRRIPWVKTVGLTRWDILPALLRVPLVPHQLWQFLSPYGGGVDLLVAQQLPAEGPLPTTPSWGLS